MTDEIYKQDTTNTRPDVLDGVSRRILLKASGIGVGGLALGASASPVAAQEEGEDDEDDQLDDPRVPYLDLETLEAELDGETLRAESFEARRPGSTTYVGEAAGHPGVFVAVSHLAEESDLAEGDEQPDDVVLYICNGEVGARNEVSLWLSGEFDESGTTFTGATEEGDEDFEVKLAFVDGAFLGTATLPDVEKPVTFVASEATGDAGLYGTESEALATNGNPLPVRWVVLADGRQRGGICVGISVKGVCVGVHID